MKFQNPSDTESAHRASDAPLRAHIVVEADDIDFLREDAILVAGTGDCGCGQFPLKMSRRHDRRPSAARGK